MSVDGHGTIRLSDNNAVSLSDDPRRRNRSTDPQPVPLFTSTPFVPEPAPNLTNRLLKIMQSSDPSPAPSPPNVVAADPPPVAAVPPTVDNVVVIEDDENEDVVVVVEEPGQDPDIIEIAIEPLPPTLPEVEGDQAGPSSAVTPNHLVSILKKKDHSDSNSPANASPVTFSESVVERSPSERKSRRQGILKKRSSLDESLYLQTLSGDESVSNVRRNSLGETRHGILKEPPSRDGSTCSQHTPDVALTPSEPHHGILKTARGQEDSPNSCDPPKHVSISQAVILAVAEMEEADESELYECERDVKPILKTGGGEQVNGKKKVRPILKKKYSSSETEESQIRPILKSSRKSSREDIDSDSESVRPCLKGDGGLSRGASSSESLALITDQDSVDNAEGRVIEKPLVSVAERIKNMESFLSQPPKAQARTLNTRRTLSKDRYKTQPITVDEFSR